MMIDLPFALPTAVSGIALATVFSPTGWLGQKLALAGVQVAYTWLGVVVALVLIGLPFVVRSVQPALIEVRKDLEDAAESLGAGGFHVFRRIILPTVHAGARDRLHARLRARHRRVRLGGVHLRQPAAQDRDHAAPDRDQARAVRLRRRGGARLLHARDVLRDAARDQPGPAVGPAAASASGRRADGRRGERRHRSPADDRAARGSRAPSCSRSLFGFLGLLLIAPLGAVLVQALAKGIGAWFAALQDPDTIASIKLTLLTAAIVVPVNTRVRHLRGLGDRALRVPRQEPPGHADRPAVRGLAGHRRPRAGVPVRHPRLVRQLAARPQRPGRSSRCRASCSRPSSSPSPTSRAS